MYQNFSGFLSLKREFPRISEARIKEGIFVGPQNREIMTDRTYDGTLIEDVGGAWKAFKSVSTNFF
jgi:hypothetical protein